MPIHPFFDPRIFGIEIVYTLTIILLCLLVFFKTREIYSLTKHRGIQFFRYAFLFFALSYASRLILHILVKGGFAFDFFILKKVLPMSNLFVAYFSTMAILYLVYSTIWRKVSSESFLTLSNVVALIIAVVAFISKSQIIILVVQLILLVATTIISIIVHKKGKKISNARVLYLLIFVFWLLNLFVVTPRKFLPFEIKLVSQILSIVIFVVIYYKVLKWIK